MFRENRDFFNGLLSEQRFFDNLANFNGGAGTPVATWTYEYEAFGRQVEVEQEAGASVRVATTAYDAEGRVTDISSPEGEIHYEYDVFGRRTRVYTGPTADPINDTRYTYDALGRLETVEVYERNDVLLSQPEVSRYRYDLAGNLDRQDKANGVIVDYVYDDLNRLDLLTHYAPDATPENLADNDKLAEFDYTVRADGRRTEATETFWLDGIAKENHLTWTYDDAGRLIDEVFDSYDNALDRSESFVYDLVGNRLRQDVDLGNDSDIDERIDYVYDANDRLQTESLDNGANGSVEQTTAYDYLGTKQTTKEVTVGSNLTSRATYGYDAQGRMSTATIESFDSSGVLTRREVTSYEYDSSGIRVAADHQVDSNGDGGFETTTRTEYLNDPSNHTGYSQVIQETVTDPATGEIQKRIVYTLGHDVISQSTTEYVAGIPGSPVTLTFGYDGHGSTRVLFDLAGAIVTIAGIQQVFHYDAYGNLLDLVATQAATSLLYSGEAFDSRVGLQYLRARWYDPNNGRFISLDPFLGNLEDPQSLHKYAYVHGDPIQGTDPSGLMTLGSLAIGTGLQGLAIGAVGGMVIAEAVYFIHTPMNEWSATGALVEMAKGAALGAFGSTVFGGAWFAIQGLYQGIQIWRDPNSSTLQKVLASGMILMSVASAWLLRSQVRSQFAEWKNVYSKIPLRAQIQTDLAAIRAAYREGKDAITLGGQTIRFGDSTKVAGTVIGDEIILMPAAFDRGDDFMMKVIIEENLHLHRIRTGAVQGDALYAGMTDDLVAEEKMIGDLVEDVFMIGRQRGWW